MTNKVGDGSLQRYGLFLDPTLDLETIDIIEKVIDENSFIANRKAAVKFICDQYVKEQRRLEND